MPILDVTDEQIIALIKQIPPERRLKILFALAEGARARHDQLLNEGEVQMRRLAAERGLNWDSLDDDKRIEFVDDLIHEDRQCRR